MHDLTPEFEDSRKPALTSEDETNSNSNRGHSFSSLSQTWMDYCRENKIPVNADTIKSQPKLDPSQKSKSIGQKSVKKSTIQSLNVYKELFDQINT